MRSPVPDYLQEILDDVGDDSGELADYIPELGAVDPDQLAVAVTTLDGTGYAAGDADLEFSIQSISKPFVYALALAEHGLDAVLQRVGVEPTGEAFNELSLERDSCRPLNPMINAGALTVHSLIGGPDAGADERVEQIRRGLSAFAGRELTIDPVVSGSEYESAFRNQAIANMLRSYGAVQGIPDDIVRGYTQQCAVTVTTKDLAMMGATLAAGGVQPITGEQVVGPDVVRQVLSVMMTCGMYDAAGDWMSTVGFPAKSGVSGGIVGVLPGQVGVATFSPRLDPHGTSTRGVRLATRMSKDMGMHIMQPTEPARAVVRRDRRLRAPDGEIVRVCSLQGSIQFTGAERVLRLVQDSAEDCQVFVLDLRRVSGLNAVAARMLAELIRRLQLDDVRVALIDPDEQLELTEDQVVQLPRRLGDLTSLARYARVRR